MKKICLLAVFLVGVFLAPVSTTAVTLEDLKKLDPYTATQVLDQLSGKAAPSHVEQADEWVGLAGRLGKALTALARETGVALNDFVKTPVGMVTAAILLWKTIGVSIVAGLIWIISLSVIVWSFRKFHVPSKVKVVVRNEKDEPIIEGDKVKEEIIYVNKYTFSTSDAKLGSAWAHAIFFVAINMMLILVIAFS